MKKIKDLKLSNLSKSSLRVIKGGQLESETACGCSGGCDAVNSAAYYSRAKMDGPIVR